MFLFNLSLPEFLALFSVLSSVVFALYLLDRTKKKHSVATLRFFTALERVPQYQHRRRLQQPWSLLLQIISILLLILALAQLRIGSRDRASSDHVLLLDTSAWMSAQTPRGRLIDIARANAKAYLKALPGNDRVMIVRADALATPATQFESDPLTLQKAIDESQPSASVLNLDQALEFAQQAQKLHAQKSGEIVFAGAGRFVPDAGGTPQAPSNLRIIPVAGPAENCGLRKLSARRSLSKPDTWDIFVSVKNYGGTARQVPLIVGFGGAPIGSKRFLLQPGAEESVNFEYATRAAGWLEARLQIKEPFAQDDRAVLELPSREPLPLTVYSDQPSLLKPVFSAIPNVKASFLPTARYTPANTARIVVLDRFSPAQAPTVDTVWIQPPAGNVPIASAGTGEKVKLARWRSDTPLAAGLRTKDLELDKAEIFRPAEGDIPVAEADRGALIVARPGKPKKVVFGFHPVLSSMKYELTTPLLFANIVRWMAPETFTTFETTAGNVGTVDIALDSEIDPANIHVVAENRRPLPFTVEGKNLRFFAGSPGIVRVSAGDRQLVYSLTLPQAGDSIWKPLKVKTGIPRKSNFQPASRDVWPWLAIAGAIGLLLDWILFGNAMRMVRAAKPVSSGTAWRKAS